MTVLITLGIAGTDSGPFDLYSNNDGYTSAFESGVSKAALLAGYASSLVPDYTVVIRVRSNNILCTNYVDIPVIESPTTTTTSSSSTSTSTTTTTSTPTTTTTTTGACPSYRYNVTFYDCGVCTVNGGGSFDNLYPLTVGKFYYYPPLNLVVGIDSYVSCGGTPIFAPILDIDQEDTCAAVICPTTTTTTTPIP
jgi:hypothetical protein